MSEPQEFALGAALVCPFCGKSASKFLGFEAPEEGSVMFCSRCMNGVTVIADGVRPATQEEMDMTQKRWGERT